VNARTDPTAARAAAPPSSVGGYYPWLDALRGLSWILVMIGHTTELGYLARLGVGIFFAISGWLITRIILGQLDGRWSLVTFYTRRAIRIVPLYYVLVLVAVSASLLFPRWKSWFEFLPPDVPEWTLWKFLLTFAVEPWRGTGGGGQLVGHTWSLGVEERFYVFWPLLLTFWPGVKASRRVLVVALIVLYWAALWLVPGSDVTVALWAMPFPLLFGCALAIFSPFPLQMSSRRITFPIGAAAFAAYIVFAGVVEGYAGPTVCTFSLVPGFLAAALTAAAIATAGDSDHLLFRALKEAGKLSYAAYLFHPIFAFLAIKAARALGLPWIGPFLGVAMIGPVAFLLHRYVETPFLNLRPRVERSRGARIFLSTLQTGPILVGIVFVFPWAGLLGELSEHPGLLAVVAASAVGALGAAGVRAGRSWGRAGLDGLTRLGQLARDSILRAVPLVNVLHRGLRRSTPFLTFLAAATLLVVVAVAATGGFRTDLGPVTVSVRGLHRPFMLLMTAVALRAVADIAPLPTPDAVPTPEETSAEGA
jgi:peptidoglycan/LPS O-acetylase OafA/YrhL